MRSYRVLKSSATGLGIGVCLGAGGQHSDDRVHAEGASTSPDWAMGAASFATGVAATVLGSLALGQTSGGSSSSIVEAIGDTPLVELRSLSKATGCRILAKAEYMNPGGSIKDRAALWLIKEAEKSGQLRPGGTICEGTGGNTGIGLALIANARGYKCKFAMSGGIAKEKIDMMRTLGAEVILTPPVPFTSPDHYFHRAAKEAFVGNLAAPGSHFFTNQFENPSSSLAHYESTAPEIWQQAGKRVDGFVCSSGTGGTIGGCSRYLKEQNPECKVFCIDPPGSGLRGLIEGGDGSITLGDSPSSPEGRTAFEGDRVVKYIERSAGDSITEGIGIDRVTANFASGLSAGCIDGCFTATDREAVEMAFYCLRNEGVFIGPSAALNVVGAVKLARKLGSGATVCTVLCDGGERYASKMYDPNWLAEKGLTPQNGGDGLEFVV